MLAERAIEQPLTETVPILLELFGCDASSKIAMFKTYLDESGYENEPVVAVAGFTGTAVQWSSFERYWGAVLAEYRIDEFHGKEFWRLDDEGKPTGKYRGWEYDKSEAFLQALIVAIRKSGIIAVGLGIRTKLFFSLSEDERRFLTTNQLYGRDWPQQGAPTHPYFLILQWPIVVSADYVPDGDKVFITMDRNETFAPKALEIYNQLLTNVPLKNRNKLGDTLAFSSRLNTPGLQAADFLVNRARTYKMTGIDQRSPAAFEILSLLESAGKDLGFMNERALDLILKGCPFRSTFWNGLTEPDYLEQLRMAGGRVLAYKGANGAYHSHYIKPEKIQVIGRLSGYLVEGSNEQFVVENVQPQSDQDRIQNPDDTSRNGKSDGQAN